MKTGPITEAKQMKQCVYNIPCEWQMLCWWKKQTFRSTYEGAYI
jgi:hypothetical protein